MKFLRLTLAVVGACLLASASSAATLEAYGRLPLIEDVAMSPDGKRIAVVVTDGQKRNIVVRNLDDGKIVTGLAAGDTKIRGVQWASPQTLLITSTVTGAILDVLGSRGEHAMVKAFDVDSGKLRNVLDRPREEALNIVFGSPMIRVVDGQTQILVKSLVFVEGSRLGLFRIVGDEPPMTVEVGLENMDDFLVDDRGASFAATSYDDHYQRWTIQVKRNNRWFVLTEGKDPHGSPTLIGFGRTPGTLLVAVDTEDGVERRELNIADGKWGATLPNDQFRGILNDRQDHFIGGVATLGDDTRYTFLNPADQATWSIIQKAFPGQWVYFAGWSDDHKRVLVEVSAVDAAPAYAWVDMNTKQAKWIGDVYPNLTANDISPIKPISYKAADGMQISGYLTLPKGKDKNLPLVVLPHGGPASRDSLGFDYWAQALASRGYAVLQPNFRGSSGYGNEFLEAGFGEWGRKMQTDLSDGVRHLSGQGVIDAKRVCIVGGSYGGYAALAGAAIDRGVYRCAASVAGISDLRRMLRQEKSDAGEASFRYWKQFMGAQNANDRKLDDISPLQQVAKVEIPVLLIHGKDDTVVPYEQSKLMADALKKAGKPVDFVTLDGEDHWLSRGDTRLKMLQAVTTFLEKNNPPT